MRFKITLIVIIVAFVGYIVFNESPDSQTTVPKTNAGNFAELIGRPAPDFTLQDYKGESFTLSKVRGKKVVLFFNEGIMCYPACWNQVAALGTDPVFSSDDVIAVSIVPDGQAEWKEATRRMPDIAKSVILLDSDNTVSNSYGTMNLPSSMHKGGKPGHTYVIIDEGGVVRYTYDDQNMGIQNDRLAKELKKLKS